MARKKCITLNFPANDFLRHRRSKAAANVRTKNHDDCTEWKKPPSPHHEHRGSPFELQMRPCKIVKIPGDLGNCELLIRFYSFPWTKIVHFCVKLLIKCFLWGNISHKNIIVEWGWFPFGVMQCKFHRAHFVKTKGGRGKEWRLRCAL